VRVRVQDDVIRKYIIKSRILADCWKKHKVLGPIPVESELKHMEGTWKVSGR
jgi:hypothetical protein